MNSEQAFKFIRQDRLMIGMRGAFTPNVALDVTSILFDEKMRVFELMMNSVQPIETMRIVKKTYGDDACVGMGTVLDVDTAKQVIDAGADFVVSPAFQPEVVQVALDAGVFVMPGVATPTEAVMAWNMGVKLLKLFPVGVLGVDYFRAIYGPLKHMNFQCNGNTNADNVPEFLKAGAISCGVAGWLTGDGSMSTDTIRRRAQLLQAKIKRTLGDKSNLV